MFYLSREGAPPGNYGAAIVLGRTFVCACAELGEAVCDAGVVHFILWNGRVDDSL